MAKIAYPKSFLHRMMFTFMVIVVFVVLTISYTLYVNFQQIGIKLVSNSNLNTLSQQSFSAVYMNDAAKNFAVSLLNSDQTTTLMLSDSEDNFEAGNRIKEIDNLISAVPFVHSVYIYNAALDTYYSTWKEMSSEATSFFDQDINMRIKKMQVANSERFKPVFRKLPVNGNNMQDQQYIDVMTYVLNQYSNNGNTIYGSVIVNIKVDYLRQLVNALAAQHGMPDNNTFIADAKGALVLAAQGNELFPSDREWQAFQSRMAGRGPSGYFLSTFQGSRYLVTYVTSDVQGWKFINLIPYRVILDDMQRLKWITFGFCAILIAVGSVLVYYFANRIYSPLRRLMGTARQLTPASSDDHDELQVLTRILGEASEQSKLLQGETRLANANKKKALLRELLNGSPEGAATVQAKLDELGIVLHANRKHAAVLLSIDRYEAFNRTFSLHDQRLIPFAIGNAGKEIFAKSFVCEAVDTEDNETVLLVEVTDQSFEASMTAMQQLLLELQAWVKHNLKLSLTATIGYSVKSLTDIRQSMQETKKLFDYRFVLGHGLIITPDSVKDMSAGEFIPPSKLEQELDEHLVYGRREEAIAAFEQIADKMSRYPYDVIIGYLYHLGYVIYKRIGEIQKHNDTTIGQPYSAFVRMIGAYETFKQIQDEFLNLFHQIAEAVVEVKVNRRSQIVDKVKAIVESNYQDKGLCLDSIAVALNISKDHLGKVFRQTSGKSVAEYITDFRLQVAAEQIAGSQQSVTEILDALGWENKNYFYTLFKNKYGMTTSEYKLKSNDENRG